ncbi:hypothetical protein IJ541_06500 [bacterium]|nr:hypothetical protein [bacterium]
MKSFIITKWIEPYKLLETIKKNYSYKDFTFDTITKNIQKQKFLKEFVNNKNSIGLYMKNVNKYYFFTALQDIDIFNELKILFELKEGDFVISDEDETPYTMVDMGKAEASIIYRD